MCLLLYCCLLPLTLARTAGAILFLRLSNRLMRSYLDPALDPLTRLKFAFYCVFVTEAWYADLKRRAAEDKEISKELAKDAKEAKLQEYREKYNCSVQDARILLTEEKKKAATAAKAVKEARKRMTSEEKKRAKKVAKLTGQTGPAPTPRRPTVGQQFITSTAAAGISFNAWFLLSYLHLLIHNPLLRSKLPFNTRLFTEQPAERMFRAVRAVMGGENFTLAEFFRRCDRSTALMMLRVIHEQDLAFPSHDSSWKWDEKQATDKLSQQLPDGITMADAVAAIKAAKASCIADMRTVGVDVSKFTEVFHFDLGALDDLEKDNADVADIVEHEIQVTIGADEVAEIAKVRALARLLAVTLTLHSSRVLGRPMYNWLTLTRCLQWES